MIPEGLTRAQIAEALRALGLEAGCIVMVHSSLSSMGHVQDGADAVVDALIDVLGPEGTLVVPTFTFSHSGEPDPVFDPARDPSEMGRISEVARTRQGARRSRHLLHSVAALGAQGEQITACHGPSAWAADGPFWKLYQLEAYILLLGVPYVPCTFFHVVEQLVQTPYRRWVERRDRVRERDGAEGPLLTLVYRPRPDSRGTTSTNLEPYWRTAGSRGWARLGTRSLACFRPRPPWRSVLRSTAKTRSSWSRPARR